MQALLLTLLGVAVIGLLVYFLPDTISRKDVDLPIPALPKPPPEVIPDARDDPRGHERAMRADEIDRRFKQAAAMLHIKEYEHAMTALHRVLELEPRLPEAHVNMGFALLGLGRPAAARDFFWSATELRPGLDNAYYGLALAFAELDEKVLAVESMETYLHLTDRNSAYATRARERVEQWRVESGRAPVDDPSAHPHSRSFDGGQVVEPVPIGEEPGRVPGEAPDSG
jgi:tetratricopeptide (TPR) repeat protein